MGQNIAKIGRALVLEFFAVYTKMTDLTYMSMLYKWTDASVFVGNT